MKTNVLQFIILFMVVASVNLTGQEPISLAEERIPLRSAIHEMENRYRLIFSFVDQLVEGYTVSGKIPDGEAYPAIQFVVSQTPLQFKLINGRTVILYGAKKNHSSDFVNAAPRVKRVSREPVTALVEKNADSSMEIPLEDLQVISDKSFFEPRGERNEPFPLELIHIPVMRSLADREKLQNNSRHESVILPVIVRVFLIGIFASSCFASN